MFLSTLLLLFKDNMVKEAALKVRKVWFQRNLRPRPIAIRWHHLHSKSDSSLLEKYINYNKPSVTQDHKNGFASPLPSLNEFAYFLS